MVQNQFLEYLDVFKFYQFNTEPYAINFPFLSLYQFFTILMKKHMRRIRQQMQHAYKNQMALIFKLLIDLLDGLKLCRMNLFYSFLGYYNHQKLFLYFHGSMQWNVQLLGYEISRVKFVRKGMMIMMCYYSIVWVGMKMMKMKNLSHLNSTLTYPSGI